MRTRLRQVVVAAIDLAVTEQLIVDHLGVERCYRDPGVGEFGLQNALFPIGDQFLEVVSPIRSGTTAERLIDRRGGDTGYMVIIEVDDLDAARQQIAAADVPIVFEAVDSGIVGLHLHPRSLATIVSIDQCEVWGEWTWAGPSWREFERTEVVTSILAVEIAANDPDRVAAAWAAVLGIEPAPVLRLDDGEIRFVGVDERGEGVVGFEFAAAPGAELVDTTIAGTRMVSVRPQ